MLLILIVVKSDTKIFGQKINFNRYLSLLLCFVLQNDFLNRRSYEPNFISSFLCFILQQICYNKTFFDRRSNNRKVFSFYLSDRRSYEPNVISSFLCFVSQHNFDQIPKWFCHFIYPIEDQMSFCYFFLSCYDGTFLDRRSNCFLISLF